jgi:diacylglycerol kinase family enzyme
MKCIALITNPLAGAGHANAHLRAARRVLWGWPLEVQESDSATIDPDRHEAVVVIGGDGTFQQVLHNIWKARGAAGPPRMQVPFLPFPAGTANDLASELGIRADWEQVQALIDRRSFGRMDLIDVNGVPFTTQAGVGLGTQLVGEFNARRQSSWLFREVSRKLKSRMYVAMSAKTLVFGKDCARELQIQAPGYSQKIRSSCVFVCNQKRLGGHLTVSSDSRARYNDDGLFQITIVPRTGRLSLLQGLASLRAGIVPQDFIQFSAEKLSIRALDNRPLSVFGDGEILVPGVEDSELRFTIHKAALPVYRELVSGVRQQAPSQVLEGVQ